MSERVKLTFTYLNDKEIAFLKIGPVRGAGGFGTAHMLVANKRFIRENYANRGSAYSCQENSQNNS